MWEKAGNAYLYKIETSTDNLNWTMVVDNTVSASTSQTQTLNFSSLARYVRITVTGGLATYWASINEFKLFDGTPLLLPNTNVAAKASDGDLTTSWQAADGNANHWWMVDLGANLAVTGSEINWVNAGVAYQYKIETSTDNSTWSTVVDKTLTTSLLQNQIDNFSTTTRYLKVTITGGVNTMNKANIADFKVFDGTTTSFSPASVIINTISNGNSTDLQTPKQKTASMFTQIPQHLRFGLSYQNH
jgi:hypothetical protein